MRLKGGHIRKAETVRRSQQGHPNLTLESPCAVAVCRMSQGLVQAQGVVLGHDRLLKIWP